MFDGVSRAFFLNPSTLSGAIDVIVVRHPDGKLKCTPFHVRFGRLQLLYSAEKIVKVTVNGESLPFQMKLGAAGEAYFVHEIEKLAEIPNEEMHLATSPIHQATPPPQNENENEKLPSQAEQILQEHPEAVAEMVEEVADKSNPIAGNEKSWDWSWGWGEVPRIESNEGKDDKIVNFTTQMEQEALVTVSEEENNTMTKLFGFLRRGKPEYLPTTETENLKSKSDDESDILFEMEEDEEDQEQSKLELGQEQLCKTDSTSASSPVSPKVHFSEDSDPSLRKLSEFTIFEPGKADSGENSPVSKRDSELSRSLSRADSKLASLKTPMAQSLPAGKELITGIKSKSPNSNSQQEDEIRFKNIQALHVLNKQSFSAPSALEISLCAKKLFDSMSSITAIEANKIFDQHCITHEELSKNPSILSKTDELAVRINHKLFPWKLAYPAFMSALLFDKPLDQETLQMLEKTEMAKYANKKAWMSWLYPSRWRSTSVQLPKAIEESSRDHPPEGTEESKLSPTDTTTQIDARTKRAKSTPMVTPLLKQQKNATNPSQQFRKSLRPTMEQIEQMKLKPGANSITFSVNTELRGTQTLAATVYLWEHDSKLVISDIDGTITKSDVFGHVLPMLGKDWSHSGVAKLFSLIRENGYHIVYLTSRAIGQAQTTRNFIFNLKQDGDTCLPKGPVFMSPDRLFGALDREVIRRKPEEFKIACLQDIAKIFPSNPYYAGFGNRKTDLVAYMEAGVPSGRVFIINPSGNITTINKTYSKTYHNMATLVNEMYPPTQEYAKGVSADYNDWNYWKLPVADLDELK